MSEKRTAYPRPVVGAAVLCAFFILHRCSSGAGILLVAALCMREGWIGLRERRVDTHSRITGERVTYKGRAAVVWSVLYLLASGWIAATGFWALSRGR